MLVARRFHTYCHTRGIDADEKLPYGFMKRFIADNIRRKPMQKALTGKRFRSWYQCWKSSPSKVLAATKDQPLKGTKDKTALRSRAPVTDCEREKAPGQGRHHKLPLVRQALYEWWTSMRYAIDGSNWSQIAAVAEKRTWPVFLAQSCVSKSTNSSKTWPTHAC